MKIVDRYLVRQFLQSFFFCITFFLTLFIIVDVFNNLDDFLKHSAPAKVLASYYLYWMPSLIVQIVPIACLIAILYVLGTLSRHNEILALKSNGVSAFTILSPYLFVGLLLSFGVLTLNELVAPKASLNSASIYEGLIKKGKQNFDERAIANVTLYGKDNRMIYAREFEIKSQSLHDVVIFEDDSHRSVSTKITAKKARYEDGAWVLYDCIRYRMNPRGELMGEPLVLKKQVSDITEKPADFLRDTARTEFMNAKELREYIGHMEGSSRKLARRLWVDWHYKIAFPFVSFVVILLGAPVAIRARKGTAAVGIGTGVLLVLLYYGMVSLCLAFGKGGLLPPPLAAWLSNIAFSFVGVYLIWKTS